MTAPPLCSPAKPPPQTSVAQSAAFLTSRVYTLDQGVREIGFSASSLPATFAAS